MCVCVFQCSIKSQFRYPICIWSITTLIDFQEYSLYTKIKYHSSFSEVQLIFSLETYFQDVIFFDT